MTAAHLHLGTSLMYHRLMSAWRHLKTNFYCSPQCTVTNRVPVANTYLLRYLDSYLNILYFCFVGQNAINSAISNVKLETRLGLLADSESVCHLLDLLWPLNESKGLFVEEKSNRVVGKANRHQRGQANPMICRHGCDGEKSRCKHETHTTDVHRHLILILHSFSEIRCIVSRKYVLLGFEKNCNHSQVFLRAIRNLAPD